MKKTHKGTQKHIVFFISALRKGGAERVLLNLVRYFSGSGYIVTLVTQYKAEQEYELDGNIKRIYSEILPEEMTQNRISNFINRYKKLRNIWKTLKPDAIVSFIGKNNIMAILTSLFLHIPVIVAVRGEPNEEYYSKGMRIGAGILFNFAGGVVLQTEDSKLFFGKMIQKRAKVLKNPLTEEFIKPLYEGPRDKTIISVGRLDENKNQQMLIRAFAKVEKVHPDYKLILYGEGDKRSELEQLAVELGVADKVEMPGNVNDISSRIQSAGIFVLTSKTEGMPNALLEAMVLGIPSVSVDCPCGGPKDIIDSGVNGYLIGRNDIDELADKINYIIEHSDVAQQMGRQAFLMRDEYMPEKVYRSWENYINQIID